MADYENLSTYEVQRLAKQGDKDALFEMRYRYPDNEEADGRIWATVWDKKASDRGHFFAKRLYACFLKDMPPSENFSKNQYEAMTLFENIVKDYNAGNYDEDDIAVGIIGKIELGIMLCEGLGIQRDYKRGIELMKSGEKDMQNFGGLRFHYLVQFGKIYALGYAQEDEEPSSHDLEQAKKYFENAVRVFSDKDSKKQFDFAKEFLEILKQQIPNKIKLEADRAKLSGEIKRITEQEQRAYNLGQAKERRNKLSQPTTQGQQIEDSVYQLRQRLAREGW